MKNLFNNSKGTNSIKLEEDTNPPWQNRPVEIESNHLVGVYKSAIRFGLRKNSDDKTTGHPSWLHNLRFYLSQYCDATTIHGIRYIGERGRLMIEKVAWFIIVIVVSTCCISLIANAYHKWTKSPVIVSFATTETGIWKIPFPAVTICPEVKSNPDVFNYTDIFMKKLVMENVTKRQNQYFETFSLVCSNFMTELNIIRGANFTTSDEIFSHLSETMPDIDPLNMSSVYWLGKKYELNDVMSLTITSEGLCYSFNMLHLEEILKDPEDNIANRSLTNSKSQKWSLEDGYPDNEKFESFPRRTFLSGISGGFIFDGLFANDSHLDYACTEGLQGFKVTLHHPSELPDMDKHFRVPLDQAVIVAVKPRMISVTEELKSYKHETRKCYFAHEKHLAFFKSYTQRNCLYECLTNYTLALCKCVAFYMPGSDNDTICGSGKIECLERSKVNYLSNRSSCSCLPFCTALDYDIEVTQTEWEWFKIFSLFGNLDPAVDLSEYTNSRVHFSKLAVFYKNLQFLGSERHELYGITDFFSNVGGLLGLFIGFSVISFLEILYFLSLRIVCNVSKFGRAFWAGEPELNEKRDD